MSSILLVLLKIFSFDVFSTFSFIFLIAETIGIPILYGLTLSTYKNGTVKGLTPAILLMHLCLILLKMIVLVVFFKIGFHSVAIFVTFAVFSIVDIIIFKIFDNDNEFPRLFFGIAINAILNILSLIAYFIV